MLYKFRFNLNLKLISKAKSRSKDEEDQPSTNIVEQKQNDVELRRIPAGPSKAECDEKLPAKHVRPPLKGRSSSVYSTASDRAVTAQSVRIFGHVRSKKAAKALAPTSIGDTNTPR
ncbi:hypothetical protein AC579_8455 [Pseudocercospora musae]|uniref:Uncharacterized protein n=1 Tax=Pseudocercospora musae TaxID=113226 RepID=A0A139I0E2_9PEZI|nr:hypothetical protein AC579_8455 [Pseudocercospora musae]